MAKKKNEHIERIKEAYKALCEAAKDMADESAEVEKKIRKGTPLIDFEKWWESTFDYICYLQELADNMHERLHDLYAINHTEREAHIRERYGGKPKSKIPDDALKSLNATGTGMPTIEPFHALTIAHTMKHGFQYIGMITVVTDVVRENNQTY